MADPLARRLGSVVRRYLPPEVLRELARALALEVADAAVDALSEERPARRVGQRASVANDINPEEVDDVARERARKALARNGIV